jgi:hypothetical protein
MMDDESKLFKSATIGRKPHIKISQTQRVVLVSISEPGLHKDEVNVVIEPKSISVELAKEGIKNPVLAGSLFGQVRKDHCRVRIKDDSIIIKLRKDAPGKWHSILDKVSTDLKAATSDNRIPPIDADRQFMEDKEDEEQEERAPIEPSIDGSTADGRSRGQVNQRIEDELAQENATIKGVLESMKAFHSKIFSGVNMDSGNETKTQVKENRQHTIMPTTSGFGVEIATEQRDESQPLARSE